VRISSQINVKILHAFETANVFTEARLGILVFVGSTFGVDIFLH
jgi:hypothetical protein